MPKNDPEYEHGYTDGFNAGTRFQAERTPPSLNIITSDAEQLSELRKALISVVNGMGCWCKIPFVNASEDRGHESRCLAARAALNPSHLQKETQ